MKTSICICTYKRPTLVRKLVERLLSDQFEKPTASYELVVVDNDPQRSALGILSDLTPLYANALVLIHVDSPNISSARNAAVKASHGDLIAFIDDDEFPCDEWLTELYATLNRFNADAVFGPVVPLYTQLTPNWIINGRYFDRPRFPTGTPVSLGNARTGNVLIRKNCFHGLEEPFNPDFGRTGGEDTFFFKSLIEKGRRLVSCDEAIVTEVVPIERASASWLLQRSYRIGQTWIRTEIYSLRKFELLHRWLYLFIKSSSYLFISLSLSVIFAIFYYPRCFSWLRLSFAQAGKITSLLGMSFHEYGH